MTDSPRVAYLTSLFARPSDTFIRNEINQLRKLGVEVVPFSIRRPDVGPDAGDDVNRFQCETNYLLEAGVASIVARGLAHAVSHPVRFLSSAALAWRTAAPGVRGMLMQSAYLLEAVYLATLLKGSKVDLLHNHIGENSATVAMLASEFSGIPYSLTIHGPYIFFAPERWALKEKLNRAAFTACISDFCRSQCMIYAPESAWPRLHVVRCSVQPEFLESPAQRDWPGVPNFLCIGRLCSEKGQAVLFEAASQLASKGQQFQLSLVGDGPARSALERHIIEKNLGESVKILGWQSSEKVQRLLRASTALVIPSFAEGLPIVAMEALAVGCPVIATNIAAMSELIENGHSGWLVPAGSAEKLAEVLKAAIDSPPEKLQQMGECGRQRVLEMHHPVRQAEQLKALLMNAIATSRANSQSNR